MPLRCRPAAAAATAAAAAAALPVLVSGGSVPFGVAALAGARAAVAARGARWASWTPRPDAALIPAMRSPLAAAPWRPAGSPAPLGTGIRSLYRLAAVRWASSTPGPSIPPPLPASAPAVEPPVAAIPSPVSMASSSLSAPVPLPSPSPPPEPRPPSAWHEHPDPRVQAKQGRHDAIVAFQHAREALRVHMPSFWHRLGVRLKLVLMGRPRPWKVDDVLALFSWIFVGHALFLLIGTTTFVSLVLFVANSLHFQEYLARKIGEGLTQSSGFTITFRSAIVPRWRNGTIRLEDVKIVCNQDTWADIMEAKYNSEHPASPDDASGSGKGALERRPFDRSQVDGNFTYWDVDIKEVDVTLSLWRWLSGQGILQECRLQGVRGVADRRHVTYDDDWLPSRRQHQPGDWEIEAFGVNDLMLEVFNPGQRPYKVSIYQGELPQLRLQWLLYDFLCADSMVGTFDNALFSIHKRQDHSLAATERLGPPQTKKSHFKISALPIAHLQTGDAEQDGFLSWLTQGNLDIDVHMFMPNPEDEGDDVLDRILDEMDTLKAKALTRFDQVIEEQRTLRRAEGRVLSGGGGGGGGRETDDDGVDEDDEAGVDDLDFEMDDEADRRRAAAAPHATASGRQAVVASELSSTSPTSSKHAIQPRRYPSPSPSPSSPSVATPTAPTDHASSHVDADGQDAAHADAHRPAAGRDEERPRSLLMFWQVRLHDLHAQIPPRQANPLSSVSTTLMRPVVAFLNSHRTSIHLSFGAEILRSQFDGAWSVHSAGMVDVLGEEVGRAVAALVADERERSRRLKRMGIWSLHSVSKSMMAVLDYTRGARGWTEYINAV